MPAPNGTMKSSVPGRVQRRGRSRLAVRSGQGSPSERARPAFIEFSSLPAESLRALLLQLEELAMSEGYRDAPEAIKIPSRTRQEIDAKVDLDDFDTLKADLDGFPDELKNLTTVEIQQLENIGSETISAGQWGYVGGADQAVKVADTPTFGGVTVGNTGLHILDTNASHDLIIKPGSDVTADRTLTLTTGDADRTVIITSAAGVHEIHHNHIWSTSLRGAAASGNNLVTTSEDVDTTSNVSRAYDMAISTEASLQDSYLVIGWTLPADFNDWAASNAVVVEYITESASYLNCHVDVYVYQDGSGTQVDAKEDNNSTSWATIVSDDSDLESAHSWAAGNVVWLFIKCETRNSYDVKIGPITFNYVRQI